MSKPLSTSARILEAGRRLFNKKGYAATTLTEIAKEIGISQGNLTYHFPTKKDLVARLAEEARREAQDRRDNRRCGSVADDYVEHLVCTMSLVWRNRFIFRDKNQLEDRALISREDPGLEADFVELFELIRSIENNRMLRPDLEIDLSMLTRALWVVSRYWMDYLMEVEGLDEIGWEDQERGVQHHFAVLLPNLTGEARDQFREALARFSKEGPDRLEPR